MEDRGVHENQYIEGNFLKTLGRGLGQFADLRREGVGKNEWVVFLSF